MRFRVSVESQCKTAKYATFNWLLLALVPLTCLLAGWLADCAVDAMKRLGELQTLCSAYINSKAISRFQFPPRQGKGRRRNLAQTLCLTEPFTIL